MRSSALALALLLCAAAAQAQSGGHPVTLWMAEGNSNQVYLLGSVHVLRKQDHPLPAIIDEAYDDAEALFMELDMDDLDPAVVQATVNRLGVLDGDQTLSSLMGNELYNEALVAAELLDIPLELLDKSEPWLAALTIEQLALARIGFEPQYGIETHLSARARQDGKSIEGFESIDEQLGFLDGLSLEAQLDLLMQTLDEGAGIRALMDDLIRAWRHGDVAYMEDTMLEDFTRSPELYDAIVADRNHRWVEKIGTLLDDRDDYLVIVGTLHLVGDDGLPELLKRRGVPIRQLRQQTGRP